jgi:hypothetical protein
MTTDLAAWLLEQITEDERGATASAEAENATSWGTRHDSNYIEDWTLVTGIEEPLSEATARHVANWDPSRVLAECDAKQRIIELHTGGHECSVYDHNGEIDSCRYVHGDLGEDCSTVRALALPYADRLGYREEWKP